MVGSQYIAVRYILQLSEEIWSNIQDAKSLLNFLQLIAHQTWILSGSR